MVEMCPSPAPVTPAPDPKGVREPSAISCGLVALSAGHAGLSFQRSSAKGDGLR